MLTGRFVFAELVSHLSPRAFRTCVERYDGNYKASRFSCWDQYLCLAFAQLTYRESLRDIEVCLRALQPKLYHVGIRARVARSTLADANETRDWRIHADFAQSLIGTARALDVNDPLAVDLANTVYALDATTIDLCLSVFPWAHYSTRLYGLTTAGAFFVTRAKASLCFTRRVSRPTDPDTGSRSDQLVVPTHKGSRAAYPAPLRRIHYVDPDTGTRLVFLTNHLTLPAVTIAQLYRSRWQVELFFKWIKQHLRIKAFYGTSANAVKTQIWIAISVYVLVAIVKKRLGLDVTLYQFLQILSLTLFEKMPISTAVSDVSLQNDDTPPANQLEVFDL